PAAPRLAAAAAAASLTDGARGAGLAGGRRPEEVLAVERAVGVGAGAKSTAVPVLTAQSRAPAAAFALGVPRLASTEVGEAGRRRIGVGGRRGASTAATDGFRAGTGIAGGATNRTRGINSRNSGCFVSRYGVPIGTIHAVAGDEADGVEGDVFDVFDDGGDAALAGLGGVGGAEFEAAEQEGALDGIETQRRSAFRSEHRGLVRGFPVGVAVEAAVDARAVGVVE